MCIYVDFDLDYIEDYYSELKNYNCIIDVSKCDSKVFDPYEIIHERIFKCEYDHLPGFDKVIDTLVEEIVSNNTF